MNFILWASQKQKHIHPRLQQHLDLQACINTENYIGPHQHATHRRKKKKKKKNKKEKGKGEDGIWGPRVTKTKNKKIK